MALSYYTRQKSSFNEKNRGKIVLENHLLGLILLKNVGEHYFGNYVSLSSKNYWSLWVSQFTRARVQRHFTLHRTRVCLLDQFSFAKTFGVSFHMFTWHLPFFSSFPLFSPISLSSLPFRECRCAFGAVVQRMSILKWAEEQIKRQENTYCLSCMNVDRIITAVVLVVRGNKLVKLIPYRGSRLSCTWYKIYILVQDHILCKELLPCHSPLLQNVFLLHASIDQTGIDAKQGCRTFREDRHPSIFFPIWNRPYWYDSQPLRLVGNQKWMLILYTCSLSKAQANQAYYS